MRIASGVTDQYIYFVAVDATDFTTRETGLSSFTVYRSRNGGAAAAMTTPTINEVDATNMPGVYELLLDEDTTLAAGNDTEEMALHITHAGMAPVTRTIELYRPKITAGNTLSVESDGDLTEVNTLTGHTAQTGDTFGQLPTNFSDLSVTASTGRTDVASIEGSDATDQIRDAILDDATRFSGADIASILTDTAEIGAAGAGLTEAGGDGDHLSAVPWNSAWDAEVQSEVDDALVALGLDHLLSAAVAGTDITDDSIIAQLVSSSATADWDSFDNATDALQAIRDRGDAAWTTGSGTGLTPLASGTAQGGSASTIQLAAGESFADDELNGNVVNITGGTGAGQSRVITDYTGSTDTATVTPDWTTTPDGTSTYEVVQGSANVAAWLSSAVNALISGRVDANAQAIANDLITAAAIATDAIGSDELAASAANEIRDAILDDATRFSGADIDAILTDTAEIGSAGAGLTEAGGDGDHLTEAGGTGDQLSAIPWNASWDTEVQSEAADALNAYDPPTYDELLAFVQLLARSDAAIGTDRSTELSAINTNEGSGAGDYDQAADSLEASQAEHDSTQTDIGNLNDISTAEVNAEADTALSDFFTSSEQLVDDVWDEALTGATHNVSTSAGRRLRELGGFSIRSGTAQAGADNSITLDSGASATDQIYDNNLVVITGGTGAGQTRIIVEYNGTTKVAIVDEAWETNPDNTSEFQILAAQQVDITQHGIAQAGTASTITLSADASAQDDIYNGQLVLIRTSTGSGQARLITDYNGTTKVATVAPDWDINPTSSSVYAILPDARAIVHDLGATAQATVNAEVLDVVNTDTFSELSSVPAASATLTQMIRWLYILARNQIEQTATTQTVRADDASTAVGSAGVSDDGNQATRGEWS